MGKINISVIVRIMFVIALLCVSISLVRGQDILQPEQDVLIVTFGGGEGCNVFIKYNITAIPAGRAIDSVFITPYITSFGSSWDGDVDFWNVNDQGWTESDSCTYIYSLPTSTQISQASGFGSSTGWDQSIDLKDIFLVDYDAGHVYCSIKIKDPDDMTTTPMPGSMPINAESLAVGNIIFDEYTVFYSREYANAPPWLVVYSHSIGINELQNMPEHRAMSIAPNPTNGPVSIILAPGVVNDKETVRIYDINGVLIHTIACCGTTSRMVTWNGSDEHGIPVPSGTYFCVVTGEGYRTVEPVCIIR